MIGRLRKRRSLPDVRAADLPAIIGAAMKEKFGYFCEYDFFRLLELKQDYCERNGYE
jgi:hypothetical protein